MNDQASDNSHPRTKETVSGVAVLGTGIMGAAMARNLLAAGLATTVWDRNPSATVPLVDAGATAAEVVFDGKAADALPPGAVWAQMGTIGVPQTTELAARLAQHRPDVT